MSTSPALIFAFERAQIISPLRVFVASLPTQLSQLSSWFCNDYVHAEPRPSAPRRWLATSATLARAEALSLPMFMRPAACVFSAEPVVDCTLFTAIRSRRQKPSAHPSPSARVGRQIGDCKGEDAIPQVLGKAEAGELGECTDLPCTRKEFRRCLTAHPSLTVLRFVLVEKFWRESLDIFGDLIDFKGLLRMWSAGNTRPLTPASGGPHSTTLRPTCITRHRVFRHLTQTNNRIDGL